MSAQKDQIRNFTFDYQLKQNLVNSKGEVEILNIGKLKVEAAGKILSAFQIAPDRGYGECAVRLLGVICDVNPELPKTHSNQEIIKTVLSNLNFEELNNLACEEFAKIEKIELGGRTKGHQFN